MRRLVCPSWILAEPLQLIGGETCYPELPTFIRRTALVLDHAS
jgi:hypothetical protein